MCRRSKCVLSVDSVYLSVRRLPNQKQNGETWLKLGEEILREGGQTKFKNERRKFARFVDTLVTRFPEAISDDKTLREPYKSLAFLVTVGQRPVTSILILEILLEAGEAPLDGKQIGQKLAKRLEIPATLTTKGGNYKDRVGDIISTFTKIGILESVSSKESDHRKEGFRIRKAFHAEVKAFVNSIDGGEGILSNAQPFRLEDLFKKRYDQKLRHVVKSGTEEKQPFSIGKIMKSLLDPKLEISFENALHALEEIEPELKTGMKTLDIQSMLYNALKKHDSKAAENYRLTYPQILTLVMSDGTTETVNYKLVKTLIEKEVKLKLTSNLVDDWASTVYNVITRNPKNYQQETTVREFIDALVHSECLHVRSVESFIRDHFESALSALEGCRYSLTSDEVGTARGLFEQFLEQISLTILVEFGYLPFRDFQENVDLITNLLKQADVKKNLKDEFKLDEKDLFQIQRIRFLFQRKDNASSESLKEMISEGQELVDLCRKIAEKTRLHVKTERTALGSSETSAPGQVSTGYIDLDNLLLGGIPEEYAVILTSPSCDERDLMILSFLETGLKQGQTTFHVTIDASGSETLAKKYQSAFQLFICNPEADTVAEGLPNVHRLRGVENLTEIDIALTSALRQLEKKPKTTRRACIEIVSDALLQHHALATRRWLTALIPKLKSRGFTVLAVMNPHMHSPQEVQAILDLFQGEIHVYRKQTEKGLRQFLRIEKMFNREYLDSELLLRKERIRK